LHQGGATLSVAMQAAEQLRDAGLDVLLQAGDASLKSQMKKADASGAEFAVIVGESEAATQSAAVKALRAQGDAWPFAQQTVLPLAALGNAVVDALEELSEI
jgi:histidyl-tRNA synthetase